MKMRRERILILFIISTVCLITFIRHDFLNPGNISDILVNSSYIAIAGCSMTMVILTGGIDVSVGSLLAVCSVVAGFTAKLTMNLPLTFTLTVLAGIAGGAVNGFLISFLNISPVLATLGTMAIYRGLIIILTGGYWITDLPDWFRYFGTGRIFSIPIPVIFAFICCVGAYFFLKYTVYGRYIYAIGSDENSARIAGINIKKIKFIVYSLQGLFIGLATLSYATRFTVVQSNTGIGFELVVITAVVVGGTSISGGRGGIPSTVLGVLLFGIISTGLIFLNVSSYWSGAVNGFMILLALIIDSFKDTGRKVKI